MERHKAVWFFLVATLLAARAQESTTPKAEQSAITIKVFKSGLFSGFAHDHVIVAPIARANVDAARLSAEITVAAKEMKVTDKEVSDKDRAEIQATMLGPKVLDSEKYPEIRFTSSRIEQTSPQRFRVTGTLELHGSKRELTFEMTAEAPAGGVALEHYHGTTKLKQSDFGIKPISLFGGSVKVKDELELELSVYAGAPAKTGSGTAGATK